MVGEGRAGSGGERAPHVTATERAVELVEIAAGAAADKLATDLIAYDVSEQLVITDAFLLCSASNDRQVRAIVDEIEDKLRKADARPVRREGEREGRWVLLDYLDVVIHVQHAEERVFYALERLWKDCPLRRSGPNPRPSTRPGSRPTESRSPWWPTAPPPHCSGSRTTWTAGRSPWWSATGRRSAWACPACWGFRSGCACWARLATAPGRSWAGGTVTGACSSTTQAGSWTRWPRRSKRRNRRLWRSSRSVPSKCPLPGRRP